MPPWVLRSWDLNVTLFSLIRSSADDLIVTKKKKKKLQSLPLLSHIILEKILLTVFTDGVQTFSLEDHN